MELALFLLKGILIGLLFGVPVGAVGTMTIQRSLEHGVKAGLITGLGSSAATVLNGALLVLGVLAGTFIWWLSLSFAAGYFKEKAVRHQTALSRIFGCLLFLFGMVI